MNEKKNKISDNLSEMKFMQRAKAAKDTPSTSVAIAKRKKAIKGIVFEPSYAIIEELIFGRFSYQGFNKDVEKLMIEQSQVNELSEGELSDEVDVGYEDVAKQFSLTQTVAKKFDRKRKADKFDDRIKGDKSVVHSKKQKSNKFLKPSDD